MSYVLSKTGAQIDAILNKAEAGGVIQKSAATFSDVNAAIALGSPVIIQDGSDLYQYSTSMGTTLFFTQMTTVNGFVPGPYLKYLTLTNTNVWSSGVMNLQSELTFDNTPTDGSTNPVTSDGIYDAIKAGVADSLITDTASGEIASFPDGADNVPVKSLVAQITPLQAGSGDPAPDNIRPISGWTGAKITVEGKNLLNNNTSVLTENKYIANVNGSIGSSGDYYATDFIPVPNKTSLSVIVSGYTKGYAVGGSVGMACYDANQVFMRGANGNTLDISGASYIRLSVGKVDINTFQCEIGSTATAYASYKTPNSVDVSWTDEAGTVYGGTLTYIGGGKYSLQATKGYKDLGAINFSKFDASGSYQTFFYTAAGAEIPNCAANGGTGSAPTNILCSQYAPSSRNDVYFTANNVGINVESNGAVYISDPSKNSLTKEDFKTAMNGVQLIYPLATLPDPIILDAEDVKTLLGDNNIFVDTGDVEVEYRASTKLYIDKMLNA